MKLLLDVYTSPIFRLSFALPVSFVYGKYSVRVKRKIFGEVQAEQAKMRRMGASRTGDCGRAERAECEPHRQRCGTGGTGGTSETSGNVRAIVGQTCDKGEYIKYLLIKF